MGYEDPLLFSESITKALMLLPYNLRQYLFKATRDCNLIDGRVNLIVLENWLERKLRTYFSPLADIIAPKDTSPIYQNPKKNKKLKKRVFFVRTRMTILPRQPMNEERVKTFSVGYVQNSIS